MGIINIVKELYKRAKMTDRERISYLREKRIKNTEDDRGNEIAEPHKEDETSISKYSTNPLDVSMEEQGWCPLKDKRRKTIAWASSSLVQPFDHKHPVNSDGSCDYSKKWVDGEKDSVFNHYGKNL